MTLLSLCDGWMSKYSVFYRISDSIGNCSLLNHCLFACRIHSGSHLLSWLDRIKPVRWCWLRLSWLDRIKPVRWCWLRLGWLLCYCFFQFAECKINDDFHVHIANLKFFGTCWNMDLFWSSWQKRIRTIKSLKFLKYNSITTSPEFHWTYWTMWQKINFFNCIRFHSSFFNTIFDFEIWIRILSYVSVLFSN